MNEIALVYVLYGDRASVLYGDRASVLYGDRASARTAARNMDEQRLAACANILAEGQSIYPWEGRIEEAGEVSVLFKTMPARREALMAALAQSHAYDLPAILSWSALTTPDYASWVAWETEV